MNSAHLISNIILAHLANVRGTYQTAKEIAAIVTPGQMSRPVAEALHALVASGHVEQEPSDVSAKRYRLA